MTDRTDGRTRRRKRNDKYSGYLLYINPIVDIIQNPVHDREILEVIHKSDSRH